MRTCLWLSVGLLAACVQAIDPERPVDAPVLFVCEHGNVKSLMAASYFNQLAADRGLEVRAVSRGVAPDSTTVPSAISQALMRDGFDVTGFRSEALSPDDLTTAQRVIAISTSLPESPGRSSASVQHWDDIPAASVDYPAARDALLRHLEQLIGELSTNGPD